jgi:hypothetical protein
MHEKSPSPQYSAQLNISSPAHRAVHPQALRKRLARQSPPNRRTYAYFNVKVFDAEGQRF